jgi:hypothetical protein
VKRRFLAALALAGGAPLIWDSAPKAQPQRAAATPASNSLPAQANPKANISYSQAKPILDAFQETLPAELKGKSPPGLEAAWPVWVARRNAQIRARLASGDEDSIVNFWLYGTTFTARARVTPTCPPCFWDARSSKAMALARPKSS